LRVLIAEDDSDTAGFIRRGLVELGHDPVVAKDGAEALHRLLEQPFHVAILDRMLPRLDGLSVVQRARAAKIQTPIILLTALGRIQDRVDGLEAGADDYLVKPFAFSELAARMNALVRRKPAEARPTMLYHGGIIIDLTKREVSRDGIPVLLQPRELRLLEELMREGGRVITRTMLLERVWNYHFDTHTNIVETHISRLRAKLNEGSKPDAIETVRGAGYRMADDA
jgi:two-component system OmpR family response regulator